MKKINKKSFIEIIQKVIGSRIKLKMDSKINDIKNLDSLNLTKIILAFQKKKKKNINFDIIELCKTLEDLYKKI
jgi:acyl carrier protein